MTVRGAEGERNARAHIDPDSPEALARRLGFVTKPGASEVCCDLRDALVAMESADYQSTEYARPLRRPILEALGWGIGGVLVWIVLAAAL